MQKIKKSLFFVLIFQLVFAFAFAQQTFEIEKKPIRNVWIKEFENFPLIYELKIESSMADNYKFFSLLDILISPSQIYVDQSPKTINLSIYIRKDLPPGKYTYTYYIKNSKEIIEDRFSFEVVNAKDIFNFSIPEKITRDDKSLKVKIKNNYNLAFDNLTLKIYNKFVDSTFDISLKPFEEKEVEATIKENIKEELSGSKDVNIELNLYGKSYTFEKQTYLEEYKEIKTEQRVESIFLGKKIYVKKINTGNSVVEVTIPIELNSFEKIFAKANIKANEIKKEKDYYIYVFKKDLKPNEVFEVELSVNYGWLLILPIIILLIILVFILRRENVEIRKDVKRVRTKSGEFALRVFINVTNKTKETLSEVALLDYLPLSLKFYEHASLTLPDKIEGNKLYWVLGEIPSGETRSISYLCYSKIKYEGKMILPKAKVKYVLKGKKYVKESNSCSIKVEEEKTEI